MAGKFYYIEQTQDQLPLTSTNFYYVNPLAILNTSKNRNIILNNISEPTKKDLLFGIQFANVVYPRFNIDSYFYNLSPSPYFSFLPNLTSKRNLNFSNITDLRALDLEKKALEFDNIYLLWSGGIDSTVILSAILKNWHRENLQKLVVVLNEYSIEENTTMYNEFIYNKLTVISTDDFFSGKINFTHNNLYVDGNSADTISAQPHFYEFDKRYPNYYLKPWKSHIDILIKFFSIGQTPQYGQDMYKHIVRSLNVNNLKVETIFDFIWWVGFNWAHDKNLHCILWQYTPSFFSNPDINLEKFLKQNVYHWFNSDEYQDWRVSAIGSDEVIGSDSSKHKLMFKKYIYNFNKDQDYLLHKGKVASTPKNKVKDSHIILCGIDTDYNYYYRYTHEKIWPPKRAF
jgi:hypothetical protein